MAIQVLQKDVGGTIETQFLDRQPSSCTVTLYTDAGTKKVDAASATVDSVATTLSSAAAAKATTIALASATGVVVNRRYRLGAATASTEPHEVVTVKSLSASTATLWAPLLVAHAAGSAVQGTRVSYAVASTAADSTWIGGWADFTPNSGDVVSEGVDCYLRKIPEFACDESDLRQIWPKADKALDAELDLPAAIKQARDMFLLDLGGKTRSHCFIGADVFRRAVAVKFWLLRRFSFGDAWTAQMDKLEAEYERLVKDLQQQTPADVDQDGTTSGRDDGGWTTISLERA